MDKTVKLLVLELPVMIENCTQRTHDDVKIVLTYLLKYVKRSYVSNTIVVNQLDHLERLLSKKYGMKITNISKHIQMIREILVGRIGSCDKKSRKWYVDKTNRFDHTTHSKNTSSRTIIGTNECSSTLDAARKRPRPQTVIPDRKTGGSNIDAEWQSRRPSSGPQGIQSPNGKTNTVQGQRLSKRPTRSETTQLEESMLLPRTNIQHAEEDDVLYHGESTDEVHFFDQCMVMLKAIINDDKKGSIEIIIPPPEKNIKEKVKTSYTHILDFARTIRGINVENRSLRKILDDINKNLLRREETSQKEFKPKEIHNDQFILELETNAKEIIQKFHETETFSEKLKREYKCLLSILHDLHKETQHLSEGKSRNVASSFWDQKASSIDDESPAYEMFKKAREIFNIQMEWKREAEYSSQLLEDLNNLSTYDGKQKTELILRQPPAQTTSGRSKDRKKDAKLNTLTEDAPSSRHSEQLQKCFANASNILKNKMEAEHAAQLLEEFNKLCLDSVQLETKPDGSQQPKQVLNDSCKNRIKDRKGEEIHKQMPVSIHFEQTKRNLAGASNSLKKHIDMRKTVQEGNYLMSMLEVLLQHAQHLYEGKTEGDLPSSLDQIESSIDRQSTVYLGLKHVREISAIHRKWKSDSEKLKREWEYLLSILDALHHDTQHVSESSVLDHLASSIVKESSAYQMFKIAKEISSIQMEWEREAEYEAHLLEELSKHSTDEGKQETEFILRQPPTPMMSHSSKDRELNKKGNTNNEEPPRSRHMEQLRKSFASASNILKKQIEGKYATRLLEELGSFSNVAKRDRTGKVLTDPPTESPHSVDANSIKRKDTSGTNTQPSFHSDNCSIHYANASHILEQMKAKEDLRAELLGNAKRLENMTKTHEKLAVQNSQLVHQVDSLRMRLSELAGAKLTHDNASIADLSDPNRPTKLAEMYSELYDNQWTDAFENLSKRNPGECDETLICCLYNILMDGYEFCQHIRDEQKSTLEKIMFDPAKYIEDGERSQKNKVNEILAKHLSEAAKLSSNVASANIVKAFVSNEDMKKRNRKALNACKIFIEECVTLCWHMQVQTPPVWIDFRAAKGQAFARDTYREYTTKGPKIAFVVWPALFLHKTGPLLLKGVAQGE